MESYSHVYESRNRSNKFANIHLEQTIRRISRLARLDEAKYLQV